MRDPSYIFKLQHSSRQCQILNPLSKTRDWTCNLIVPIWILSHDGNSLMEHPWHQYQHSSRTNAQSAQSPSLQVWGWELPILGPSITSPITERLLCHYAQWALCHCHDNHWVCTFNWKATLPTLGPPDLYIRMDLTTNMCQDQCRGSNTASQE